MNILVFKKIFKLIFFLIPALLIYTWGCNQGQTGEYTLTAENLKCEYLTNPRGVEKKHPFLSWEVKAPNQRNIYQSSYRLIVYLEEEMQKTSPEPFWDSGKIKSENSVNIEYAGPPLQSAKKYYWKVQIEDNNGTVSQFSDLSFFETGIQDDKDWLAEWVYCPNIDTTNYPYVRYDFELEEIPAYAPAFVTSVGFHELYVNGEKAGDMVLSPSVSDLRNRALYTSYDISFYLKKGENNIIIWLASGWANFSDANPIVDFDVENKPLCKAQFKIGESNWIFTDNSWKYVPSNTFHLGKWQNSNFGGDIIDDSYRNIDWAWVKMDESEWRNVEVCDPGLAISSDFLEPNRMVIKRTAQTVTKVGSKKYQIKVDTIYTGWIETHLKGKPNQSISIMASSHPDKDVEFNQKNILTIDESGEGTFRNRFTYHQVEYITIEGLDYEPALMDVVGWQVTNDRAMNGDFQCSNSLLNQIYNNTRYTYESLSTGGMTVDCPHRERLGYGGDGHSSMEIAIDAFSSHPFLSKWAQDWIDIQDESGRINHTAPTIGGGGGPAWSGFILTLPWEVYLNYGDLRILEKTFPAALRWLNYLEQNIGEKGLLETVSSGKWNYQNGNKWLFLGDWATPHGNTAGESDEAVLFNNCYYVYVLKIASDIAGLLKMEQEAIRLSNKANEVTEVINQIFYDSQNYTYINTRQANLVLPLVAGIVPEKDIPYVERNLEQEILVNQAGHFDTGIHGTYFLTKYLTARGKNQLLYILTNQKTFPSYGEMISRGEVTWAEYWSVCNSRVHGCLNGIGGWFQRGILGIQAEPDEPGFKKMRIKPAVIDSLHWAKGYHLSPYGRIEVSWENKNDDYHLEVSIPENTDALVFIPCKSVNDITEGGIPISKNKQLKRQKFENGYAELQLGSGHYSFQSKIDSKR